MAKSHLRLYTTDVEFYYHRGKYTNVHDENVSCNRSTLCHKKTIPYKKK